MRNIAFEINNQNILYPPTPSFRVETKIKKFPVLPVLPLVTAL
jgi:hypothetical protein